MTAPRFGPQRAAEVCEEEKTCSLGSSSEALPEPPGS